MFIHYYYHHVFQLSLSHLRPPSFLLSCSTYARHDQGEINIAQPWSIQVEARAKWDAWKAQSGKSQDQAEQEYIAYAAELVSTYGLSQ